MKKLILLPLLFLSFAQAETIQCKVTKVIDGNNIVCEKDNKEQVNVKLYGIDSPDLDQPYGEEVKRDLSLFIAKDSINTGRWHRTRTARIKVLNKEKNEDKNLLGILIYAPCEPDFLGR